MTKKEREERELLDRAAESDNLLVLRLLDIIRRLDEDWDGPTPKEARLARELIRLVDGRVRRLRVQVTDLLAQQHREANTADIIALVTTGEVRYGDEDE